MWPRRRLYRSSRYMWMSLGAFGPTDSLNPRASSLGESRTACSRIRNRTRVQGGRNVEANPLANV
eukprot:8192451-Pyramimonas_sp.AAC.1